MTAACSGAPSGAAFRAERERRGLSQRACAAELGVARATIERWEHGQSRIPLAAWRLLCSLPLRDGDGDGDRNIEDDV